MRRAVTLAVALCLMALMIPAGAEGVMRGTVSLAGAEDAARANVERAVKALSGYYLPYGSCFSLLGAAGPCTAEGGYLPARDGAGETVMGGGLERVAAALYLALMGSPSGIQYDGLSFYGDAFAESYVPEAQAVKVDAASGVDLCFYNYAGDLTIGISEDGEYIYCTVTPAVRNGNWGGDQALAGRACLTLPWAGDLKSNLLLACGSVNDVTLCPGDAFSFNDLIGPRTPEYGYLSALNGQGTETGGGGVDALASALYLAVRDLASVEILEMSTYGGRFTQGYVSDPRAAVWTDPAAGADFAFRYTGEGSLAIYARFEGTELICEVYETTY